MLMEEVLHLWTTVYLETLFRVLKQYKIRWVLFLFWKSYFLSNMRHPRVSILLLVFIFSFNVICVLCLTQECFTYSTTTSIMIRGNWWKPRTIPGLLSDLPMYSQRGNQHELGMKSQGLHWWEAMSLSHAGMVTPLAMEAIDSLGAMHCYNFC